MLKMINVTEILLYKFRDNLSSDKIKDCTGYSKTTIIKYNREFEKFRKYYSKENNKVLEIDELIEEFVQSYSYNKPESKPRVMTSEIISEIDNMIKENEFKCLTGFKKQTKRKEHIYNTLVKKGYDASYSSVCKYITKKYGKNIRDQSGQKQRNV
jgi:hypothetical protein